jgi:hypothetical protein
MAAIGYYITPALIGGASDQMLSSVIAFYATGSANWSMAAAIGLVLLVLTLMLYASTTGCRAIRFRQATMMRCNSPSRLCHACRPLPGRAAAGGAAARLHLQRLPDLSDSRLVDRWFANCSRRRSGAGRSSTA